MVVGGFWAVTKIEGYLVRWRSARCLHCMTSACIAMTEAAAPGPLAPNACLPVNNPRLPVNNPACLLTTPPAVIGAPGPRFVGQPRLLPGGPAHDLHGRQQLLQHHCLPAHQGSGGGCGLVWLPNAAAGCRPGSGHEQAGRLSGGATSRGPRSCRPSPPPPMAGLSRQVQAGEEGRVSKPTPVQSMPTASSWAGMGCQGGGAPTRCPGPCNGVSRRTLAASFESHENDLFGGVPHGRPLPF